jgi:hypothetical protein
MPEKPSLYGRPTNQERRAELLALLDDALHLILIRGWHGQLGLEVTIVDGTIQESSVERVRCRR